MGYEKDSKKIYIELLIERLSEEIKLHKKYFVNKKIDIRKILNSCKDEIILTEKDEETILSKFKN